MVIFNTQNACSLETWLSSKEDRIYLELIPYSQRGKIIKQRRYLWSHYAESYFELDYGSLVDPIMKIIKQNFPDAELITSKNLFYRLPKTRTLEELRNNFNKFTDDYVQEYKQLKM